VSADSWVGELKRPITHNKYLYVGNDPLNRIDPSGHMDLSSSMAGLAGAAILASATLALINWKPMPSDSFDPANPYRKFSIFDAIVIPRVNAASDTATTTIVDDVEKEKKRRNPDHHTIPVYLCGGVRQELYARTSPVDHVAIHAEIAAIKLTITAGEAYAYKVLGYQRKWEVLKLAQTEAGRSAIAGALALVYNPAWWNTGNPTIGQAFTASVENYKNGTNTSLPSCTR
jgi:hypothetical protein